MKGSTIDDALAGTRLKRLPHHDNVLVFDADAVDGYDLAIYGAALPHYERLEAFASRCWNHWEQPTFRQ